MINWRTSNCKDKVQNLLQPPQITKFPKSITVFSQEDVDLHCNAFGDPTPSIRWRKNGVEFGTEHSGSGTLQTTAEEAVENYTGNYRCYASNILGTAMTQEVKVIVESSPVIPKRKKQSKKAFEGESIVLTCNPPQSSSPPKIHWMDFTMVHINQSDRVMTGLDGNLYFSNLLSSDSRDDYICNAQYPAALTILTVTAVRLSVLPNNDVVPGRKTALFRPAGLQSSILALKGQNITLECIPKGLPTPVVEWRKKDGTLKDVSSRLMNHNRWLHFGNISQEDDGEYECKASNSFGFATHTFTVTVEAAPYWVKEPQNHMYSPGETVRLDCLADGSPAPSITWSINGQPLAEVDEDARRSITGSSLILRDVRVSDTAVYQCEATNRHGSILLNINLFVVELPPQILSSDGVVYRVIEGADVNLHCESFGSPRPHTTWARGDMVSLLLDARASLFTNGTIRLSGVSREDSGTYTCSVTHTNISITANLEVFNQTIISEGPKDIRVLEGTTAFLDCDFYKDPRLLDSHLVWKRDGVELQESLPDYRYKIFENGTLKMTKLHLNDSADYSCEVSTLLDHVTAKGSITVLVPPHSPRSLSVSGVGASRVILRWVAGPSHNSPITEFIVEAEEKLHTGEGKAIWKKWERVSGSHTQTQLTLRPFCTYRFRIIAVNEIGESRPSEPTEDHVTPPAVPDKNPTDVRSDSRDSGTLSITWTKVEKRFHNGDSFHYRVFWREAEGAGTETNWKHEDVSSPPFLVVNTSTYKRFEIKVQALNSIGKGPEPETRIGYSAEEKPEDSPTEVSTVVKNCTVAVRWRPPKRVRGLLKGFKIYFRSLGPRSSESQRSSGKHHHVVRREKPERGNHKDKKSWELEVEGADTSKEVDGLRWYWRYELSVTAFNSKGEGPPSPPHHFQTPEGVPGPPAALWFKSPTDTTLVLHWSPPLDANGVLVGYMVQYKEESQDSPMRMQMIHDPSVNHIRLKDLNPSSYYRFKVIAQTVIGAGEPIKARLATLLEGVPPSNVTVDPSNTSFNLSWTPGERNRNHGFHIYYMKKNGAASIQWEESEMVNSTQGFYSLTGLQPGTQYHLKIMKGNDTQWEDVLWTIGPVPSEMPGGVAWLTGLISAIVLLVLILLIFCLVKRRKGGKYAVKVKEEKEVDYEARPMKDETFGEYRSLESDGDEKRSDSQPSICDDSKLGSVDSLAEYGDSVDIQFNEDGSFIGQYSGRAAPPHGFKGSDPTSPVDAAPPLPIVPSMSSILNRPS
ncbi:neural cell adhesion molecule L1.1 isoform X2 [Oryzias melastigma]|uniref:neural cell adhesion molecule L1.1 isoform X2 n=1 Tax=Oryzias melastigma TaxID=30732 RepID=UPI00168D56FA|nr:neural cell adhesion molecule L1.1 isoform X2 [Oryzias melastigma]